MKETLMWILDYVDQSGAKINTGEKGYARNRDFAHSIGLKSDTVGWMEMNLSAVDYINVLEKAKAFCKENSCELRGYYRCAPDYRESDWYILKLPFFKFYPDFDDFIDENGQNIRIAALPAYNEGPDLLHNYASERFIEIYKKYNMKGLKFCWVRDTGKYASKQYFNIFGEHYISKAAQPFELNYRSERKKKLADFFIKDKISEKYDAIGGALPEIYGYFRDLTVYAPNYYPKNEMPESGFAFFSESRFSHPQMLVHRNEAEILIREKIISTKNLEPALFYQDVPFSHKELPAVPFSVPGDKLISSRNAVYENFITIERPVRKATEKQALSILRKAAKQHAEYIDKKIPKQKADEISNTEFAFLVPYYLVTAGGSISDEYHFLQYEQAVEFNSEFQNDMANDDYAREILPKGIVFGACADGDLILHLDDGKVVRVNHEQPEVLEEWPSVAQFIFDCTEIDEE